MSDFNELQKNIIKDFAKVAKKIDQENKGFKHIDFDWVVDKIQKIKDGTDMFLNNPTEENFRKLWSPENIWAAKMKAHATNVLKVNSLKQIARIFQEIKNANEYNEKWEGKLKVKGSLREYWAKLKNKPDEPLENSCADDVLILFGFKKPRNYLDFKNKFEQFKKEYLSIVGGEKVTGYSIHIEIDQLFNVVDKLQLGDFEDVDDFDYKDLAENIIKLKEAEPEQDEGIIKKLDLSPGSYTKDQALASLFMNEEEFDRILNALKYKQNIILAGPPGVGKTFVAKKIAYAIMGEKDDSRIQMIQFHQSYAYEDFIRGYRPTDEGKFVLNDGIFYEFCQKAIADQGRDYFFIIDEINRGNLSKIFGELMMLIEKDKRGKEFSVPLVYNNTGEKKFYIPKNVYLIGTMNTADKSLAIVDYALRRRFSYIFMEPQFGKKFQEFLKDKQVNKTLINRIIDSLKELNLVILQDTKNLGKGYMIGHSFFCPNGDYDKYDIDWYSGIIENEIQPLLEEYWFDDIGKAEQEVNKLLSV